MFAISSKQKRGNLLIAESWSGNLPRFNSTDAMFLAKWRALDEVKRRSIIVITALLGVNAGSWIIGGLVLHGHAGMLGLALVAWSLGLRHALDADHISAIDNVTRLLIAQDQLPATVGLFFSLGHSTIVIIVSLIIAIATSAYDRINGFSNVGGIIGSSVSASFLLLIGIANTIVLYRLVKGYTSTPTGCVGRTTTRLFRLINKPWKMYPLGVLFGLGFDTSTEIALLGISAIQGSNHVPVWEIMFFPFLFTAGMALVDTIDAVLMLFAYTGRAMKGPRRDTKQDVKDTTMPDDNLPLDVSASSSPSRLHFNIALTLLSILTALIVGLTEIMGLVMNAVCKDDSTCLSSPWWSFWGWMNNHFTEIGAGIVGLFLVALFSAWIYIRFVTPRRNVPPALPT